jgi:hypothetical protein
MNPRHATNRYHYLLVASLIASGSLIRLQPALADPVPINGGQNSAAPGVIENQATANFTDGADGAILGIVSDKVTATVAEVAGISVVQSGSSGSAYRSSTVYINFTIKNEGNDPTQFFIPGAAANATIGGVALPAGNIGAFQVIEYTTVAPITNAVTTTAITTNNIVPTAGAATGATTGTLKNLPNGGSIPAGGYIKVRVPITIPSSANSSDVINITLGNTTGSPTTTNTAYIANTNDLYTQDNTDGTTSETSGAPLNGVREASAIGTITVGAPPNINIGGTVWDDANGSGTPAFTGIQNGGELGANVTPAINAILVDSVTGSVVATSPVGTDGKYNFNIPGAQPNQLYVVIHTTAGTVGQPAPGTVGQPALSLPPTWTNTTPLTYASLPFSVGTVDLTGATGKDFGIDKLPVTIAVTGTSLANPAGTTQYQVPTLQGTDSEDGVLGSGNTFKILTIPNATTQGTLYYNGVAVPAAGLTINNYDPTKLTFDPVDGAVTMTFTYAAIDAAGKQDPNTNITATQAFTVTNIGITGKVWYDFDNSAAGSFSNIASTGESGTNAVFGTTNIPVKAIAIDTTTGFVIDTQVVNADGTYSFPSIPPGTNIKIILAPTAGSIGSTPPAAAAPIGWVATSPMDTGSFNSGYSPLVRDFGIRQKAKFVLVKRVTKVNGATTNANDGTSLTGVITDTFNNAGNWPTNYLIGNTNAGLVKPGDTIEYTIYFLNNQGANASSVKICDPIRGAQTYVASSMQLQLGGAITPTALTDVADNNDRAYLYAAGSAPSDCNAGAISGGDPGVAIGITGVTTTNQPAQTAVPGATGIGTPTTAYGLFRFTTKVTP